MNVERGVVAPTLGVADHRRELRQLLQRLGLGLLAEPVAVGDRHAVGVDQVVDQLPHTLLGAFGEVTLDVFAADVLAANAVDQGDTATPAVALLGGAGQHFAVEVEVGDVVVVAEQARGADDDVHAGPQLEVVKVSVVPEGVEALEEAGLVDDGVLQRGRQVHRLGLRRRRGVVGALPGVGPRRDVEVGQFVAQRDEIGRVVGLLRVARGDVVPVVRGDAGLDIEEAVRLRAGGLFVAVAGQTQLLGDHVDVGFADRGVVVLAVVGFVGQADAGLFEVHDVRAGVLGVAEYGDVEDVRPHVDGLEGSDGTGQRRLVGGVVDGVEGGPDRRGTGRLDGVGVHERAVQRLRLGCGAVLVLQDVADLALGVFRELVKGTVARLVVRQPVRVDPRAVDETEQIVGWFDNRGKSGRIEAGRQICGHGLILAGFGDVPSDLPRPVFSHSERHARYWTERRIVLMA